MLELFGSGYVIEHCIAAFRREEEQKADTLRWRSYVADTLQAITNNTTHYLIPGVGEVDYGSTMQARYIDLVMPRETKTEPEDTRSCHEIVSDMWQRIRGRG